MGVKIELHRVDGDGVVEIPSGCTILGRGPFLGCDDKRVSRNHAALELRDSGDLFLVSKHVNPCFLLKKDGEVVKKAVTKGSEVELKDGYQFSLLQDGYTYDVSIVDECSPTLSMPDEDEEPEKAANEEEKTPSPVPQLEETKEEPPTNPTPLSSSQKKGNGGKNRVLPSWMTQPSSVLAGGPKPAGRGKATGGQAKGRGKKEEITPNTKKVAKVGERADEMDLEGGSKQVQKVLQVTPEKKRTPKRAINESDSESESPKRKAKQVKDSGSDTPSPRKTPNRRELSDSNSDTSSPKKKKTPSKMEVSDSEEEEDRAASAPKKNAPKRRKVSDSEEEEDEGTSSSKRDERVPCQYGSKCYRKNVDHRKEFSHPGDDDYAEYKSEDDNKEDDERPECEYGTNCYRKNPQHRKQFKHTETPKKQRKAKKEAKKLKKWRDAEDPELNDYDYGDPFLNDDSSDDYQPTDSESESEPSQSLDADDEDNLRRTLKEAKRFTR